MNNYQLVHPSIPKNKDGRSRGGRYKFVQEKNMNKRKMLKKE